MHTRYKMISDKSQTNIIVTIPIRTDAIEWTRSIVLISISENLEMTQKYASLECDTIIEPAPIASTVNSFAFSESSPNTDSNGSIIEEAVMIATVEEPCAVLISAVNKKGNQIPKDLRSNISLNCFPISVAANTAPNAPPAP